MAWGRGELREVVNNTQFTGPSGVGRHAIALAAMQRVEQAQGTVVDAAARHHRALIELEDARNALCKLLPDYGIIGTIGQSEPQE